MSINQLPNNELSIEIDMRDLLRAKKEKLSNEPERAVHDFSGNGFSHIRSIRSGEIDHLVEGLQGVREKLNVLMVSGLKARSREICRVQRFSSPTNQDRLGQHGTGHQSVACRLDRRA